jgi:CRP-like cAMP-binding protein
MNEGDRHQDNRLIAAMPAGVRAQFGSHLEIVPLTPRTVLAEAGSSLRYAYFPHVGVICLMAALSKGAVETATVGPEGFVGFEVLLGSTTASQKGLVQVAGVASRVPIEVLAELARDSAPLRDLLRGYVRYFMIQVLQSVACNGLHSVRQRCARWLLMAHDRAGADGFHLTQEFLGELLGIQRPSVTIVAHATDSRVDPLQPRSDYDHRSSRPRRSCVRVLRHGPRGIELLEGLLIDIAPHRPEIGQPQFGVDDL